MFATLQSSLKIGSVALALAFASSSGMTADPVRASFERMLAHEPMLTRAPAETRGPVDPLIAALVVPLRDGTRFASPTVATDPVAESYARMFNHEPNRIAPVLPASAGTDPLIAAIVWPLQRTNSYVVAGVTPPARQ
jgi:hypothetical protein